MVKLIVIFSASTREPAVNLAESEAHRARTAYFKNALLALKAMPGRELVSLEEDMVVGTEGAGVEFQVVAVPNGPSVDQDTFANAVKTLKTLCNVSQSPI